MALGIFEDKLSKPSEEDVAKVLQQTGVLWQQVREHLAENHPPIVEEWKNYGKASGWTLLFKQKKRTLLYLFPCSGSFIAQFVFGEKAVEQALQSELPAAVIESIKAAQPYVEGRSFRIEVKTPVELEVVQQLIGIKVHF